MAISSSGDRSEVLEEIISTRLTVTTTAQEAKVGASALEERQTLLMSNIGVQTVYYGLSSSVTTSGANQGLKIEPEETLELNVSENVPIWVIVASGTDDIIVWEGR